MTDWFAENSSALVSGLLNIVLILVLALILRAVAGRMITHAVRRMIGSQQRLNRAASKIGRQEQGPERADERQSQRAETIGSVLRSIATAVIAGVAFVMVLGEFGIELAPIIAGAGVLGLAVGFGAQSLVKDFLAGMFMMIEDQYGVGDVVDTGDAVGTVEAVSLRLTKIRDLNGGLWYVRNGEIMRVCNLNQDWANAVVELPLDYSVDIAHAERVIEASIGEFAADPQYKPKILEAPDLNGVIGIGNGSVTVRIIVTTKPGAQWELGNALRAHLKNSFDTHGVQVAHPLLPTGGSGAVKQG
ncbi:mechanosensitive ion channel family protein [Halopolyspora algeriensis]|uniref:mechanosensitive ion channel family protein n=1 Tax=Halopolyspora algeriensis TaxID=1500506 RepID=UPI001FE37D88|nr:mechanosensitive ion channel family protein [Halopolyspora algeriensis]